VPSYLQYLRELVLVLVSAMGLVEFDLGLFRHRRQLLAWERYVPLNRQYLYGRVLVSCQVERRLHYQVTPVGERDEVREYLVEQRLDCQVILGRERDELLIHL
jgi:hypothetical protein